MNDQFPHVTPHRRSRNRRRGQVLVEFAIIAFVLYLLLAIALEFGRAMHSAQGIQQAADVCARELARVPLPPGMSFLDAMTQPTVRQRVYDPRKLVINLDDDSKREGLSVEDFVNSLPPVNQHLMTLLIYDKIEGVNYLRYPGAVHTDPSPAPNLSGLLVKIPALNSTGGWLWLDVVEEVTSAGGFAVTASGGGMVGIRVNYPYQAAALTEFEQPGNQPVEADDDNPLGTTPAPLAGLKTPDVIPEQPLRPYDGPYGLGRRAALGKEVRPFRRVLSAQAAFRREVFQ